MQDEGCNCWFPGEHKRRRGARGRRRRPLIVKVTSQTTLSWLRSPVIVLKYLHKQELAFVTVGTCCLLQRSFSTWSQYKRFCKTIRSYATSLTYGIYEKTIFILRVRFGYQLLSKTATCPGEGAYKPSSLLIFSLKPGVVLLSSNVNCLKAVCFLLSGKTKVRRNKNKAEEEIGWWSYSKGINE